MQLKPFKSDTFNLSLIFVYFFFHFFHSFMCSKFSLCLSFSSIRNTVVLIVGMSIQVTIEQKSLKSHRQLINSVSELLMWFYLSPCLSPPLDLILFASLIDEFSMFCGIFDGFPKKGKKKTDKNLNSAPFFFFIENVQNQIEKLSFT